MSIIQNVVEICELPKDAVMGVMLITFIGQNELIIENYKCINEFTDTDLKVIGLRSRIHIIGQSLMICNYNGVEMKVKGIINELKFY